MKTLILTVGILLALFVGTALAACVTHTITTAGGRLIVCTTCCYGPYTCNTTCF